MRGEEEGGSRSTARSEWGGGGQHAVSGGGQGARSEGSSVTRGGWSGWRLCILDGSYCGF